MNRNQALRIIKNALDSGHVEFQRALDTNPGSDAFAADPCTDVPAMTFVIQNGEPNWVYHLSGAFTQETLEALLFFMKEEKDNDPHFYFAEYMMRNQPKKREQKPT